MSMSAEMLGLLAPAFAAGFVVACTHVPLGQEVLRRGIIFIDLAIAQIAALGVVVSHSVFQIEDGVGPVFAAMLFALAGGGLFAWLEREVPDYQEAFIGSAFVLSASAIILLLADNPHGGEEMQSLLAGQVLWVSWKQLFVTAGIYAVVIALWSAFQQRRGVLFYVVFPLCVTLSVQLVGVYLVFASLIFPALAVVGFERGRIFIGVALASGSYALGLLLSYFLDLPSGPAIVLAMAGVCFVPCFVKVCFKSNSLHSL